MVVKKIEAYEVGLSPDEAAHLVALLGANSKNHADPTYKMYVILYKAMHGTDPNG